MRLNLCARGPILAGLVAALAAQTGNSSAATHAYKGMCDASAAVGLPGDRFVVANDEDNILRIYRRGSADKPTELPLTFLNAPEEADIEGAARIGDLIYWITSHGQNRKAKDKPSRLRLFTTRLTSQGGAPVLTEGPGKPFTDLRPLLFADKFKALGLKAAAKLAPEEGGLNIEGLAVAPDGKNLLIGLRSPVTKDGALVITLDISGGLDKPVVKDPLRLKLGPGVGVRSLERVGKDYRIVAGPAGNTGAFRLYRWAGPPATAVTAMSVLPLRPEALFVSDTGTLEILSDDGDEPVGSGVCKDAPADARTFRGTTIKDK